MDNTTIFVRKMPFEKYSYILTTEARNRHAYINDHWLDMMNWLTEQGINYRIDGNILSFTNEQDESFFLMRYFNG